MGLVGGCCSLLDRITSAVAIKGDQCCCQKGKFDISVLLLLFGRGRYSQKTRRRMTYVSSVSASSNRAIGMVDDAARRLRWSSCKIIFPLGFSKTAHAEMGSFGKVGGPGISWPLHLRRVRQWNMCGLGELERLHRLRAIGTFPPALRALPCCRCAPPAGDFGHWLYISDCCGFGLLPPFLYKGSSNSPCIYRSIGIIFIVVVVPPLHVVVIGVFAC